LNPAAAEDRSYLPPYRLRRVTQYIHAHLQGKLRLVELSALVHMSPYYFARLFKRSTGLPPHRFLVRCRVDEARALLAARTASIAEISRSVGFRTSSHFTTTFRRITGVTPSAYRRAAGMGRIPAAATAAGTRDLGPMAGQAELKGSAGPVVPDGPQSPAVRLDDRTADRQPYSHAARLAREEGAE
jgi:AraC-like DNA-binding protein